MKSMKSLGEDYSCHSTLKKSVVDFKRDKKGTDDEAWPGHPNLATTDDSLYDDK